MEIKFVFADDEDRTEFFETLKLTRQVRPSDQAAEKTDGKELSVDEVESEVIADLTDLISAQYFKGLRKKERKTGGFAVNKLNRFRGKASK